MPLRDLLQRIQDDLRHGRFTSEAAVSQGVVLPLFQEIGWPVFNTRVVWPEYSVEGGRVDFALCHPSGHPVIFVEVKRVGQAEGADRQLFEYAFHQGVPVAVLTDGQEWHLYLPAEQGHYNERRVYKLDLLERDIDESELRLRRYLEYTAVCDARALESARADYRDVNRERQVRENLPRAWNELLDDSDDPLVELLAEKVEDLCGYKPDLELCSDFIRSVARDRTVEARSQASLTPRRQVRQVIASPSVARAPKSDEMGFTLAGEFHRCRSAKDVLVQVLQEFDRRDSTFLERFASRKHGRKRRYVATDRQALYPDRHDLADNPYNSEELRTGWFANTHWGRRSIEKILRVACDVASVPFGAELQLLLG